MVEQSIKIGIIYGLLSAFIFAVMSQFVKILGPDVPVSMLLFFRFFISLLILIPFLIRDKEFKFGLIPPYPKLYLIRIVCPLIALGIIFYSINRFEIVNVLLLQNSAPLFVPVIAWLIFRVSTPFKVKLGLITGFIGLAIILKPSINIVEQLHSFLPLLAGVLIAMASISIRLIGNVNTPNQMFFYFFYISTVISGIYAAFTWKTPETINQWMLIIGIGVSGLFYQVLLSLSFMKAPVRLTSPLIFMQTVFVALIDWIIWSSVPSISTLTGAFLVITGGIITIYFGLGMVRKI